jgi:hypothetical protein
MKPNQTPITKRKWHAERIPLKKMTIGILLFPPCKEYGSTKPKLPNYLRPSIYFPYLSKIPVLSRKMQQERKGNY